MPRKTPVDELLKEEAVAASPVRRSSRLVSSTIASTSSPAVPKTRRTSVTETAPGVPPKMRRNSVTKEKEPDAVKTPARRGRKASTSSVTDEAESTQSSTPARRSRKASTSSVTDELESKPISRRSSVTKDEAPEPKTKATKASVSKEKAVNDAKPQTRRASITKEEAGPSTTRTRRSSITKEEVPPARTTRRRGSLVHEDTPVKAAPVRRTRSTSADEDKKVDEVEAPVVLNRSTLEDIGESNKEDVEAPEKLSKAAPRAKKIAKVDLDLSIIAESSFIEENSVHKKDLNNSKIVSPAKEVSAIEETTLDNEVMEILTESSSQEKLNKTSVGSDDSFHFSMSEHEESPQPNSNFGGVINSIEEDECEPMDVDECAQSTVIESEVNITNIDTIEKLTDSKVNVSLSPIKTLTDELALDMKPSEEPRKEKKISEIANTTQSPKNDANASHLVVGDAQEIITLNDGLKENVADASLSKELSFVDQQPTNVDTKTTTIEPSLVVETFNTPKKEESELNASSVKKIIDPPEKSINEEKQSSPENKTCLVEETLSKSVTPKKALVEETEESKMNTSTDKETLETSLVVDTRNKSLNESDIEKSIDTNEDTSSLNKSTESNKDVPHEEILEIPDPSSSDEEEINIVQHAEADIVADAEIVQNEIDHSLHEREINYIPESPILQNGQDHSESEEEFELPEHPNAQNEIFQNGRESSLSEEELESSQSADPRIQIVENGINHSSSEEEQDSPQLPNPEHQIVENRMNRSLREDELETPQSPDPRNQIAENGINHSLSEELDSLQSPNPENPIGQNIVADRIMSEDELESRQSPSPRHQVALNIIPEDIVSEEEMSPEKVNQNRIGDSNVSKEETIPEKSPQKSAISEEEIIENISRTTTSCSGEIVNKSPQKTPTKKSQLNTEEESDSDSIEEASNISLNGSILEEEVNMCESAANTSDYQNTSQTSIKKQKKRTTSSIVIQENVKVADASNSNFTNRISDVVQIFCSGIPKSAGNVSVNLSLDYVGTCSESEKQSNDTSSEEEPIPEPPVDQGATKRSKRRKIFHASTYDVAKALEEESTSPEQELITKRQNRKRKLTSNLNEHGSALKIPKKNNKEDRPKLKGKSKRKHARKVLKPTTMPLNPGWAVENIQLTPSKSN